MNCPVCDCVDSKKLINIKSGNFDQSVLYSSIRIISCINCGHIFNELNDRETADLGFHYLNEYANCHNFKETKNKENVLEITQKNLSHYLSQLNELNFDRRFNTNQRYDEIVLDQFIEHTIRPSDVFRNSLSQLNKGGVLKISCPNVEQYTIKKNHFPNYYFLIREHIQHFDAAHLIYLGNSFGFTPTKIEMGEIEIIKNVYMPNMIICFEKIEEKLKLTIDKLHFIAQQLVKEEVIKSLKIKIKKGFDYYCYGIGREFQFLYANNYFKDINLVGLIDNTPIKQTYTIKGLQIKNDTIIKSLPKESVIIITAYAHKKLIADKLKKLGYKGEII